ncbi:MAG: hypothetical protein DWC02_05870 [Candidatus Poseidoniales archaeon]|nr:MAG: hypothetical protein DWC02_05870 [Candidatus Poseidoniales archaeon]
MVDTTLVIIALGGLIVVLAGILTTKAVKKRGNKRVNIWESKQDSPQVNSNINRTPISPPPAHLFSQR